MSKVPPGYEGGERTAGKLEGAGPTSDAAVRRSSDEQLKGGKGGGKGVVTYTYDPNQKTLDERLLDGTLTRNRRGGVSDEQAKHEHTAASARAAFEARLAQAGDVQKDSATRAMLQNAIEKCVLFSGMSETQKGMIIDVSVMHAKHSRCRLSRAAAERELMVCVLIGWV